MDTAELLRKFTEEASDEAFTGLVDRHIDLVYSTALRRLNGDAHLAQDVTQVVFNDLARKARALPSNVVLGGWLYRDTLFRTAETVRNERRRQRREQTAAEMNACQDDSGDAWKQIAPHLDDAMEWLGSRDRDAIVLRFFERQDLRAVGAALGTNEDAAQKRVGRALEKLRAFLSKRGATLSAGGLATVLAHEAVGAAPAGLSATVAGIAIAGATAAPTTLTLIKIMTMTKLKLGIAGAMVVAGIATPIALQQQTNSRLRIENADLRQQIGELNRLRSENQRLAGIKADTRELERLRNEHDELLRLRAQVAVARQGEPKVAAPPGPARERKTGLLPSTLSTQQGQPDAPTVPLLPSDQWANVGTATPDAAFQTFQWALDKHDAATFAQAVAYAPGFKAQADALFAAAPESVRQQFGSVDGVLAAMISGDHPGPKMVGFAVVSQNIDGDSGTIIEQHQYDDGRVRQNPFPVQHFDDGWRIVMDNPKLLGGLQQTLTVAASRGQGANGR